MDLASRSQKVLKGWPLPPPPVQYSPTLFSFCSRPRSLPLLSAMADQQQQQQFKIALPNGELRRFAVNNRYEAVSQQVAGFVNAAPSTFRCVRSLF